MELLVEVNRLRRFTVGELAETFQVSKRTIIRDLQALEAIGVPLYSEVGPHGGYRILNERLLPPIAFTEEEAAAIFFAYQSLQQLGDLPFDAETRTALAKFYSYLPPDTKSRIESMKHRMAFHIPKRPVGSPHIKQLLSASIRQQTLRIVYDSRDAMRDRIIQPVGIFAENGVWYCPAYCYQRRDIRLFRADRILEAEPYESPVPATGTPFSDIHLGNWRDRLSQGFEWISLEVHLTKEGVRRALTESWMADRIVIEPDGSGHYEGNVPKQDLSFFASFFVGMGTEAKVVKPEPLLELMRTRTEDLMRQYGWNDCPK
jgi:predicted DNA-binding transcriptional regulator YafY